MQSIVLLSPKGQRPHMLPVHSNTVSLGLNLQQRSVRVILDVDGVSMLISCLCNYKLILVCLENLHQLVVISTLSQKGCEILACAADKTCQSCPVVGEIMSFTVLSSSLAAEGYFTLTKILLVDNDVFKHNIVAVPLITYGVMEGGIPTAQPQGGVLCDYSSRVQL